MTLQLNRNASPILMRNYGRIVQDMIKYACSLPQDKERDSLEVYIAQCMRQRNLVWNRDQEAGINRVREDIIRLSGGQLTCDSEVFHRLMAQPNSVPNQPKKEKEIMEEINQFKVFAGSKGETLAKGICEQLGCQLGKLHVDRFSDGEFCTYFEESVRGQSVYLVQPTCPNSDNLMELLLMIDAAKRASAYKVVAVIPYFGWARQDRKDKPRVSIGAKLVANMLQVAGADRVITVDLHADQIQGFFDIPVDHVYGANVLASYIASLNLKKLIVASPDIGGSKRASNYAKKLHGLTNREVPMVICYKNRPDFNKVSEIRVLGDVYGKDVVIVDDIADTAGTLCKAAEVMKEGGAKSVRAVVTHGVLSGKAVENIEASALEELVCTDSLPLENVRCSKLHIESLARPIAQTIRAIQTHTSVSENNER